MSNPAEKHVDDEQKRKALETITKLGNAFKGMGAGGGRPVPYTPIGKSLEALGLEPKVMDIMIGDEPVECLVIPLNELMQREWQHMGGGITYNREAPPVVTPTKMEEPHD